MPSPYLLLRHCISQEIKSTQTHITKIVCVCAGKDETEALKSNFKLSWLCLEAVRRNDIHGHVQRMLQPTENSTLQTIDRVLYSSVRPASDSQSPQIRAE